MAVRSLLRRGRSSSTKSPMRRGRSGEVGVGGARAVLRYCAWCLCDAAMRARMYATNLVPYAAKCVDVECYASDA